MNPVEIAALDALDPLDLWLALETERHCQLCTAALKAVGGRLAAPGEVWRALVVAVCHHLANQWLQHYREADAAGWPPAIMAAVRAQNERAWRWRFERGLIPRTKPRNRGSRRVRFFELSFLL